MKKVKKRYVGKIGLAKASPFFMPKTLCHKELGVIIKFPGV